MIFNKLKLYLKIVFLGCGLLLWNLNITYAQDTDDMFTSDNFFNDASLYKDPKKTETKNNNKGWTQKKIKNKPKSPVYNPQHNQQKMRQAIGNVVSGEQFKEIPVTEQITIEANGTKLLKFDKKFKLAYITDPKIATITRIDDNNFFLVGLAVGTVNLYVLDINMEPILTSKVEVVFVDLDVKKLKKMLAEKFTNARDLQIEVVKSGVVVSGTVANAETAKQILDIVRGFIPKSANNNSLQKTGVQQNQNTKTGVQQNQNTKTGIQQLQTPEVSPVINHLKIRNHGQVNIRVRFAEMDRSIIKNLGFKVTPYHMTTNAAGAVIPTAGWGYKISKKLSTSLDFDYLQGMLEVGEKHGLVNMLSEPNITTVSGKPATIYVGGSVPQVAAGGTNGTTTISPVGYGVKLAITPTVISDTLISLSLSPTVSSLDSANTYSANGNKGVATTNRSASTTVEIASGQSFAIAGLIEERNVGGVSKDIPLLADLPLLGALFRSKSYTKKQTELVIIVTAFIVEPDSYNQLATPIDGGKMNFSWLSLLLDNGNSLIDIPSSGEVIEIQQKDKFEGDNGFSY